MTEPSILVFDSGLGGLTVFREVVKARPDARYVYAADDAFYPYGRLAQDALLERVPDVIGGLIDEHAPDLVVVACNTASTVVLPRLRERFSVPFVGTVPAIKPACAMSKSRRVSVLGTPGTVEREYTQALIRDFGAGCDVLLVGSDALADLAEASLRGKAVDDASILCEIAPCFVDADGRRTDVVVLACTHYPLLLERLEALQLWPVDWLDPAPAIARRVADLLGPASTRTPSSIPPRIVFTSGTAPSPELAQALRGFGFGASPD